MSKRLKPIVEHYTYTEGDTIVGVKIDYLKKTVSLVDKEDKPQHWVFTDRTLEYMQGWKNILYVMNHAVQHAEKRLQAYEDNETEDFVKLMIDVDRELSKQAEEEAS